MTESDLRALALFFYFALLDDRKAIECAIQALSYCQEKKRRDPDMESSEVVIHATNKVWQSVQNKIQRGLPNTSIQSGWVLPPNVDLGPWREFQKTATGDELTAVIWSRVLNYKDESISRALNLTVGTVRYRLAKGFRKLGSMTQQFPHPSAMGASRV